MGSRRGTILPQYGIHLNRVRPFLPLDKACHPISGTTAP